MYTACTTRHHYDISRFYGVRVEKRQRTQNKNKNYSNGKITLLHYNTNNGNVYNYIRQIAIISLAETKICTFFLLPIILIISIHGQTKIMRRIKETIFKNIMLYYGKRELK